MAQKGTPCCGEGRRDGQKKPEQRCQRTSGRPRRGLAARRPQRTAHRPQEMSSYWPNVRASVRSGRGVFSFSGATGTFAEVAAKALKKDHRASGWRKGQNEVGSEALQVAAAAVRVFVFVNRYSRIFGCLCRVRGQGAGERHDGRRTVGGCRQSINSLCARQT